jgi:D-alanyl-lipoteichoic acid acyltransferase DltB (MBOAT superfamily)
MMLFYSSLYIGFLFFTATLYYSVKNKYKHIVLFAASLGLITYISWEVALYAVVFSTVNYFLGIQIEKNRPNPELRRRIFWFIIVLDIGFLAFFKYFGLFSGAISGLISIFPGQTHWIIGKLMIPLGISYYTFQALGYIIRINRGTDKPEKDYLKFVTFLIFFPKFFSGPVERSNRFFPQINTLGEFKKENVFDGLRLILWGAFKKFAIASSFYFPVYQIYKDIHSYSGSSLLIVFFLQTIYIYMEFSGYTDMALGSAKIFGINLIDNFNRPFLAKNISDYWRRWHISLSSWCNDFIYSPFIVKYRKYENLAVVSGIFLTFFTVGIWHAANWTFVILGLLQGIAIVYEFYTKKYRLKIASRYPKSLVNAFSRIIVFLFVCVSMVLFFSPSISDAWYFLSHLLDFNSSTAIGTLLIHDKFIFGFAVLCFVLLFVIEMLNEKGKNLFALYIKQPVWLQWIGYLGLILAIYFVNPDVLPFEYMKF